MIALGIDIGGTSVKAAALRAGAIVGTGRSGTYARPDRGALANAIREAVHAAAAATATVTEGATQAAARVIAEPRGGPAQAVPQPADRPAATTAAVAGPGKCGATASAVRPVSGEAISALGLCVPGLLDERRERVVRSVNLPALEGVPLAEVVAAVAPGARPWVFTDARAAAADIYAANDLTGRLLAVVIGTGVGAAVLDPAGPLHVDGDSPGHLGQCDVSLDADPPAGPDGGAGSLEAYLGVAALARAYGSVGRALDAMAATDPPMRALARAIRIAHAIYRPHHVCLAGGIGIRLARLAPALRAAVDDRLTDIARADWTLTTAAHDFHAAAGAARLAAAGVLVR